MVYDGTNIFSSGGGRAALPGVRQRAHRQNGKNVCGHQPFRCRARGVSRVLRPTAPARKNEVLRAVAAERLSLRGAQRVFGVARGAIALWPQKKPKLCRL